jgi:VIT1/CCC1 family predicted Fe2+/Mn2+ transporter
MPPSPSAVPGAESWFHERQSAWLYRRLAAVEHEERKRQLFQSLAEAAERQALTWEREARMTAAQVAAFRPSLRARIVDRLLTLFGPGPLRGVLTAMKLRGLSVYNAPLTLPGHPMPTSVEEVGRRHRGFAGGNLRAAVFGVNDGLISNASLILGIGGAGVASNTLLTSGVAGLLAGALSMAAGEYVSVRSQREMFEYQIALEKEELDEYPEEEAEELALIYAARGMPIDKARAVSSEMMRNPAHALDVLAREELGLNPDSLGSPWGAAGFSFAAFAGGAFIPLLPIIVGVSGVRTLPVCAGLTLICLFAVGMILSLFTGRAALRGGLRMAFIGLAAGAVSFGIGRLLGAVIS